MLVALRQTVTPARSTAGGGGLLRGNAERVAAGMLVNACVLTVDDHGDVELTPTTRTALHLLPHIEDTQAEGEKRGRADA